MSDDPTMTNPPPDQRNEHTFKDAFNEHYTYLARYVRWKFPWADVEDIVQVAFLKLWNNWARFDGDNPRAWLTRVATTAAIDAWRARRARLMYGFDEVDPADLTSALGIPEFDYRTTEMLQACQRLPWHYRVVFISRVCGLTVEEIAAEQCYSKGTVSSYLHGARRQLRKLLDDPEQHGGSASGRTRRDRGPDSRDRTGGPAQNSGDA